jgi:hypothetical protein
MFYFLLRSVLPEFCHCLVICIFSTFQKQFHPQTRLRYCWLICMHFSLSDITNPHVKNRDSPFGIVLSYRLDDQGSRVRFLAMAWNFSLHHHVQNSCGGPPSLLSNGYQVPRVLSLGVKQLGHEADHSPPSSAEVKHA